MIQDSRIIEDVFFHIPDEDPIHENMDEFKAVCNHFYSGLYEAIKLHIQDYKLSPLLTLNPSNEHEDIKFFGEWHFILEHPIEADIRRPRVRDDLDMHHAL